MKALWKSFFVDAHGSWDEELFFMKLSKKLSKINHRSYGHNMININYSRIKF